MATLEDLIGTPANAQTSTKVQESAAPLPEPRRLPPHAGKGRAKGVPNKLTSRVRAALIEALELAGQDAARADALDAGKTVEEANAAALAGGAVDYLRRLAWRQPRAFGALLGKLLPAHVVGDDEGGPLRVEISRIERVIVSPGDVAQQRKAG